MRPRWSRPVAPSARQVSAGCFCSRSRRRSAAAVSHRSTQPPQLPVPAEWPQGAAYEASAPGAAAVSEIGWREFYPDDRLRTVVEQSLTNNRDLRIATLNIERARALYRIRRADQFPTVEAVASSTADKIPASISPTGDGSTYREYRVEVGFASYELDLFGRVRNLKEQALQEYLAVVETQRSAYLSLVAEVAAVWVTLATDQALLDARAGYVCEPAHVFRADPAQLRASALRRRSISSGPAPASKRRATTSPRTRDSSRRTAMRCSCSWGRRCPRRCCPTRRSTRSRP